MCICLRVLFFLFLINTLFLSIELQCVEGEGESNSNANADNKQLLILYVLLYNLIQFHKIIIYFFFVIQLECPLDTHDPGFDSKHLFSVGVIHHDLIFELFYYYNKFI